MPIAMLAGEMLRGAEWLDSCELGPCFEPHAVPVTDPRDTVAGSEGARSETLNAWVGSCAAAMGLDRWRVEASARSIPAADPFAASIGRRGSAGA